MALIHPGIAAAKRRREALDEAKMLRQIQHHNIINYIDAFESESIMSIEMEYADGGSIHDKIGSHCKAGYVP